MKKHGYYIYTLTPPKVLKRFTVVALIMGVFVLGLCTVPKRSRKTYNFLAKKSIGSVFMDKNTDQFFATDNTKIKIHSFFSNLSPVFADSPMSVAMFGKGAEQTKTTPQKSDVAMAKGEEKEISERSIVSKGLEIKNETGYTVNTDELVTAERKYSATGSEPKVLIVHTHGCETYSDKNGFGLGKDGEYRTTDTEKNMIKIGEVITETFNREGINVIHDKTLCDYPQYNSSYVKSLEVIESYLLKYPSIEFVFDIHRDAIADESGNPTKLICNINGETVAQAMIVCGTDAMGLENPNWQENLILALKIQKNLEERYPGFMRPLNIRKERFNMHKTKGSLLFEIGTHGNTMEEAVRSAKYLAEGIAETIN